MMNSKTEKKRVKGFTLIELIVVIAIIAILLAIVMPSMMGYYRSSRIRSANADAKMVYNAAQTEIMRYMNIDRSAINPPSCFGTGMWIAYDSHGTVSYYVGPDAPSAMAQATVADTPATNAPGAAAFDVVQRVNRTVSGASEVCWAVYVNGYIVQAGVSASNANSNYVGHYSANKQTATMNDIAGNYSGVYLNRLSSIAGQYTASGKASDTPKPDKP